MFINFSNHSSAQWSTSQKAAALKYGEIIDVPFPVVPTGASTSYIDTMAEIYVEGILSMYPSAVMCQGEFTLALAVVSKLKSRGVTVMAACSERIVTEVTKDGVTHKATVFEFVEFREYVVDLHKAMIVQ